MRQEIIEHIRYFHTGMFSIPLRAIQLELWPELMDDLNVHGGWVKATMMDGEQVEVKMVDGKIVEIKDEYGKPMDINKR